MTRLFSIATLLLCSCCCSPGPTPGTEPTQDLQELTTRATHSWLNARVTEAEWTKLSDSDAKWLKADSLKTLTQAIVEIPESNDDKLVWNFEALIKSIQSTSVYISRAPPITEVEFLEMLKGAIRTFKYEE